MVRILGLSEDSVYILDEVRFSLNAGDSADCGRCHFNGIIRSYIHHIEGKCTTLALTVLVTFSLEI
jgi:hypothetical protein